MSETVRTYSAGSGRAYRARNPYVRWVLIGGIIVLSVWLLWATRDSHDMGAFVPAQQNYEVYVGDFINKRAQIAQSQVWTLVPPDSGLAEIPAQLSGNFGMPEWVLNNLIYGRCHVSGQDLAQFGDLLFITRMTRIGCLIERFHGFASGIEDEEAGGLQIRTITDAGLFYAVRGRVLLDSPSRRALIHSLTLTEDELLPEETLAEGWAAIGQEDLTARLLLQPEDPLGPYLERLNFTLRLAPAEGVMTAQGVLRPAWREQAAALLADAAPQPLKLPPTGIAQIAGDFGKPLPEVWRALDAALAPQGGLAAYVGKWMPAPDGMAAPAVAMMQEALKHAGTGWAIAWNGIDSNAMIPMPEVTATFSADGQAVRQFLAQWPAIAATLPAGTEGLPQYNAEGNYLHLPLFGGPSLEPTAAMLGDQLLISSSRTRAEQLLLAPVEAQSTQEPGNLYVRIRPLPCVQAIVEAGGQFVVFGALRGHTQESFEAAAQQWTAMASKVQEITALAAVEDGEVQLNLRVQVQPVSAS